MTGPLLRLALGATRAEVAPARGGRVARLTVDGRDAVVPMTGWGADQRVWPKAGAYPLVPYSNRIRDGILRFGGTEHRLAPHPDAHPHTLHGTGHLAPWTVAEASEARAELVLVHAPDADWPWAFEARQTIALRPDGVAVTLSCRNTGAEACPIGLGWHPFVPASPAALIAVDATRMWPLDALSLPDGSAVPYRADGPAPDSCHLSDWTRATLTEPDGWRITLTADALFDHFIVWRPPGGIYACLEPVSHLADGFNAVALGRADADAAGLRILGPGETLSGRVVMTAGSAGG
jgi:aldose 1-epimerase